MWNPWRMSATEQAECWDHPQVTRGLHCVTGCCNQPSDRLPETFRKLPRVFENVNFFIVSIYLLRVYYVPGTARGHIIRMCHWTKQTKTPDPVGLAFR